MILKDLVVDEVIVEIAHSKVFNLERFEQVLGQRLKNEAAEHDEARILVKNVGLYEVGIIWFQLDLDTHRLMISQQIDFNFVTFQLPLDNLGQVNVLAVQFNRLVTDDAMTIDGKQDIAGFQLASGAGIAFDGADQDSGIVVGKSQCPARCGVSQALRHDREVDIPAVISVGDIGQEPLYHRCRNHEPDILGDVTGVTLKSDADDFAVLQYRTA